jgi:hypothetical protein
MLNDAIVVGHYQGTACGGADTLPKDSLRQTLLELERRGVVTGKPVLLEGPTGREPMLAGDVRVVYLRREAEDCLWHWEQRQRAKGLAINRATMARRVRIGIVRLERMVQAYHENGVSTTTTESRETAQAEIERLLGRRTK